MLPNLARQGGLLPVVDLIDRLDQVHGHVKLFAQMNECAHVLGKQLPP